MSQTTRLVATAALAVILTVVVMLIASRPAAAQSSVVICADYTPITAGKAQTWMAQQIHSGRSHFVSIENGLCAW